MPDRRAATSVAARHLRAAQMRPTLLVAACTAALLVPTAVFACSVDTGARVTLESDAVDPDVFVWDSRARLAAYVAGGWDSTRSVMAHTVLASPGTRALVVVCVDGAMHPRFADGSADAVGVRVVGGPFRGRTGWVVSSDVRAEPREQVRRSHNLRPPGLDIR